MGVCISREEIEEIFDLGEYRSTGIFVLCKDKGESRKFLIVKSSKGSDSWMFPQGGIERGEGLEDNFYRELSEEIGVGVEDVRILAPGFYSECVDISGMGMSRGFSKGKCFVYSLGEYVGDGDFVLDEDEVSEVKWVSREEISDYLIDCRAEMLDLAIYVLDKVSKS